MMKKLMLVCMTLMVVSMGGCTYDLEEREGIYTSVQSAENVSGECDHYFQYSLPVYYVDSNIYPTIQYHYVSCAKYGIDPLCDFYPRCEAHQAVEDPSGIIRFTLAYNGHQYQIVPQKCTICQQSAGQKYILAETAE